MRIRGYIVPPRTGKMQLVLSSDDNSELWLSPGPDPFARKRVAWIAGDGRYGYTSPREAHRMSSQRAEPIQVEQGRTYYFDAFYKERSGDDHFALRWRFDAEKETSQIPPSALRPWVPTATDADGDGLPDTWQEQTGLVGCPEPDSWGDPDHDGVVNFDEYLAGTDPMDGNPAAGFLLWEGWYGLEGSEVADLVRSPSFSGDPDTAIFLHSAATPILTCGNFGGRLSGFIVPSEGGNYEFAISGDNSVELWLSGNAGTGGKRRVAFSDRWRKPGPGQWEETASQVSVPIALQAGESYYVEVLHKDSGSPGWASLGWRKEGEQSFSVVAPQFLRSPGLGKNAARGELAAGLGASQTFQTLPEELRKKIRFSEHGDPDRDGIPNWLEFQNGTDPLKGEKIAGALTREWWFNVPGQSLAKAREDGALLRPPSMVTMSDGALGEENTTDWFVSRLRGSVKAPSTGSYRFFVAGDDHCELWLSSDDRKFQKRLIASVAPASWQKAEAPAFTKPQEWDKYPTQESEVIELQQGREYFIEVLHKDGNGTDHVSIGWQKKGPGSKTWSERALVDASALASHPGDPDDADDDYLPDSWERQLGLDPGDNGLKDRGKQGEAGDYDGDGLSNREEFLLGTNPCNVDSDGDGVGDYDETKVYGSDPTRRDASPPVKLSDVRLGRFQSTRGSWSLSPQETLYSSGRQQAVDLTFNLDAPGVYLVELSAIARTVGDYLYPVPVIVRLDGAELGRSTVTGLESSPRWLTPWLEPGVHTVTIDNRNVHSEVGLEILGVSIYKHEGEDLNGNGLADWIEGLFRKSNRIDLATAESAVSPICLEGAARVPSTVAVSKGETTVNAKEALSGHWFANLALDPDRETPFKVSFEGGAFEETRSVRWSETNIFDAGDVLKVRVGDSLKMVAIPSGTDGRSTQVSWTLQGNLLGDGSGAEPRVFTFSEPGKFTLLASTLTGAESLSASMRIEVMAADFGTPFSVAAGSERVWKLEGLPLGMFVEQDQPLQLEEQESASSGSRRFLAKYPAGQTGEPRVLARLSPGGPISAVTAVNAFRIIGSTESGGARQVSVLPDGTRVIEVLFMVEGKIPADLSVWLSFYVTDAVFANGSSRYHLTAADFDENGVARITMYKAPGEGIPYICHWIRAYEDEGGAGETSASDETEAGE